MIIDYYRPNPPFVNIYYFKIIIIIDNLHCTIIFFGFTRCPWQAVRLYTDRDFTDETLVSEDTDDYDNHDDHEDHDDYEDQEDHEYHDDHN